MPASARAVGTKLVRLKKFSDDNEWQVQESKRIKKYRGRALAVEGKNLAINDKKLPSQVILYPRPKKNKIDVIGLVGIETYLQGVLASEIPASWPMEALKAQAIATRTYTLFKMEEKKKAAFDVESTVMDQVFDFRKLKALPKKLRNRVRRAIEETRGMVLLNKNGKIFPAYYHSHCGGHAEEPHHVWKNAVFFKGRKDRFCKGAPNTNWSKKISLKQLAKNLYLKGKIKEFKILKKSKSGRALRILVTNNQGHKKLMSGQELRERVGFKTIKSTKFKHKIVKNQLVLKGQGFGHGSGLCQWGARGAARKRLSHEKILKHYYPNAVMLNLGKQSLASL